MHIVVHTIHYILYCIYTLHVYINYMYITLMYIYITYITYNTIYYILVVWITNYYNPVKMLWVQLAPSKTRNVEVLTPLTCDVTLFRNKVFADVVNIRWGHSGLEWDLNPMTCVFIRKKIWRMAYKQVRRPCEDGGVDWNDATPSQEMPRIAIILH